ncbi:MAG: hypothetical protein WBB28_18865 [Crinalium sp.]
MTSPIIVKAKPIRRNNWLEKIIALIAAINFCLVLFNISYIHWRDIYINEIPSLTQLYDPIQGIEPHRETVRYLEQVNQLEEQVMQTGLASNEVEQLLEQLRFLSNEIIEDNPFAGANKSGLLEKIKNEIRDRVGIRSAHQAFAKFWSQEHLTTAGWQQEIGFFNSKIRPLMNYNYYRGIDINGKFVDKFWQIDLPFVILFGLEFLARTFYIGRRNPHLNWLEAMLRRWYDVLLLLPFWRWLRVIPVTVRLYQSELLNLEPLRAQINRDFVANFAEEMTEVVGVQIINQMQESIKRGDVAQWLFHPESRRAYVEVNKVNEVGAIASRLVNLSVYQVIPKIQPDLEALLQHTIENALNQIPVYKQLKNVPGLNQLPTQITDNLVANLSQTAYSTLVNAIEDPVGAELNARLSKNFIKSLELELQKQQNTQEIQSLLVDMLEEIKINYVKQIAESGVGKTLEETQKVQRLN